MDPDQQIRAVAVQAAASLVQRGVSPLDFLVACDVAASYIANGRDAAIATFLQDAPDVPQVAQSIEPQPANLVEPAQVHHRPAALPTPIPAQSVRSEPVDKTEGEEIPLEANAPVSPSQESARRMVEKTRRARAANIAAQASVAKVRAHLANLVTEAEDSLLDDVMVTPPGRNEPIALGAYLSSLQGS